MGIGKLLRNGNIRNAYDRIMIMSLKIEAFEPYISFEYLKYTSSVIEEVMPVARMHKEIFIRPELLDPVGYQIKISSINLFEDTPEMSVTFEILNKQKERINGMFCGLYNELDPRGKPRIEVYGEFANNTHRAVSISERPIRNMTGIIGPYEDAFCKVLATAYNREVKRKVFTNHGRESRLVQNYINRGYDLYGTTGALLLTKIFLP
ncbi:MAG TPA: hypothetical protein VF828_00950 [Patescibacteria group bacterium]